MMVVSKVFQKADYLVGQKGSQLVEMKIDD
jgi:hypothetical protein